MGVLLEAGRYRVHLIEWRMMETKASKLPQFVIRFRAVEFWAGDAWRPFQGSDNEITGWFNLIKKDGTLNDFTLKALRHALGWDGQSFNGLQDGDWTQAQITVRNEKDQAGEDKLKVAFLNHWDDSGKKPMDQKTLSRWDEKLKASKADSIKLNSEILEDLSIF
jgi:hypothetical protein